MALDLATFATKLCRTREMCAESPQQLADATGIARTRLDAMERAIQAPTGDEVLILADHYHIDFQFFISNESSLQVDRAEKLFRAHSADLTREDRLAIQEFIYLCENEALLEGELARPAALTFRAPKRGTYFKGHGVDAASALRTALRYQPREVPDVFRDVRRLGIRLFRRRLANPAISGLFINLDAAGPCLLVNYNEDVYRQRFTAAHEFAHALFDSDDEYVVSFVTSGHKDSREVRADSFAGAFLVPSEIISSLPAIEWSDDQLLRFAEQLKVNAAVLAIALQREGRITPQETASFSKLKMPRAYKSDPELPHSLSARSRERKVALLERGISSYYVELCLEGFQRHKISRSRLAEMLLVDSGELEELLDLFAPKAPT